MRLFIVGVVAFDSLNFTKPRYSWLGLAVNRLAPWYAGLFFVTIVFTFSYLFFYSVSGHCLLFFLILLGALITLTSFSIINALLSLIFTYVLTSIVFFLAGLDFLGLMLIFVYVGAIAILFLFVVMTLSLQRITSLKFFNFFDVVCLFIYMTFILLFAIIVIRSDFGYLLFNTRFELNMKYTTDAYTLNEFLVNLGYSLYGEQIFLFFVVTLILFLGFFCPIVLTLEEDAKNRLPTTDVLAYPSNKAVNFTKTFVKLFFFGTVFLYLLISLIAIFVF